MQSRQHIQMHLSCISGVFILHREYNPAMKNKSLRQNFFKDNYSHIDYAHK